MTKNKNNNLIIMTAGELPYFRYKLPNSDKWITEIEYRELILFGKLPPKSKMKIYKVSE